MTTSKIGEPVPDKVVGIIEFRGRIFVALERGVYVKDADSDTFRQCEFVPHGPESEG